jgi:hypothetical protein
MPAQPHLCSTSMGPRIDCITILRLYLNHAIYLFYHYDGVAQRDKSVLP